MEFVQQNSLFSYDGAMCVRNDYYYQECQICLDICPLDAFSIVRHKLTLDTLTCNSCAGCVGSCPSEALTLKGFDVNAFILQHQEGLLKPLSCKEESVCLGIFSKEHLSVLALRQKEPLVCDLSHCEGCSINTQNTLLEAIKKSIYEANTFLNVIKQPTIVIDDNVTQEPEKRRLFRKAFEGFKGKLEEKTSANNVLSVAKEKSKLPAKYLLLNETIKERIDSFERSSFRESISLFTQKKIDFNRCTLCKDCVEFCPTDALFLTSDKQGIFFRHAHCIGCGICDDICKSDAISTKEGFDLLSIATNRAEALVYYELVRCNECKTPYAYKGGEPICDRCSSFLGESEDLFTLAKDM